MPVSDGGYGSGMASHVLHLPRRHHRRQHHLIDELHHLKEIEEKGDSPLTALIVLAQVSLGLLVVVTIEMAIAMSFYFGWL